MGRILVGRCSNCGYKSETLYFGSGKCDYNEVCNYPAFDNIQRKVTSGNIMEREAKHLINPSLIFYDNDSLHSQKSGSDEVSYTWDDYRLFMEGNYCPHCQEFSLSFNSIGLYD